MNITSGFSTAIALTVLAGQGAMADPEARNHGINKPQDVKSAAQTAPESSDIEKLQRKYLEDGVFTSAERKDLEKQIKDRQDLWQQLAQQR